MAARKRIANQILWNVNVFACLFLLYVLSIGPMFWTWYDAHTVNGSKFIVLFYEPLKMMSNIPIFGDMVDRYISWWNFG